MSATANKTPIILAASGTATAAADTYDRIEARCRQAFPGHPIHWAYSSRAIRRRIHARTGEAPPTPANRLDHLYASGDRNAVVQSLHLICGIEFHHLVWEAARRPMEIQLGLPLLSTPEDFESLLDWIAAVLPSGSHEALVLVGHGTEHPAWMTYALLAQMITARFGRRIVVGQVKGDPSPAVVGERLLAAGCRRVTLRPLMVVAGAHFMADIAGEQAGSWQTQLSQRGLAVTSVAEGLGAHPAIIDIFMRHIATAMKSRPLDLD
ncbi:MAG: sirohydrochlorin cobaltochelatase [Desulfobacterales bacterium]|jgi:sirohydrochlorin cobaltochelatase